MAQNTIFSIDAAGNLVRMAPGAPAEEVEIQSLIARFPDMIGDDGDLLTICREAAIGDAEGAGGRWSLDNLFVTRAGVPVLVEVKRASDTRIRREVVGQMLDYAANAVKHWPAGEMARSFAARCVADDLDPAVALAGFLGGDENDFWDRVDANLKAGKLRLLFVADRIPPELARIVEFLNEQMQAEVLAVELSWFVSTDGGRALVPRVIGATQRAAAVKQQASGGATRLVSPEEWIDAGLGRQSDESVGAVREFVAFADRIGASLRASSWLAAIVRGDDGEEMNLFALYPTCRLAVNLSTASKRPAFSDPTVLARTVEELTVIGGPLSKGITYPSFAASAMLDLPRRTRLLSALTEFADLCRRSATSRPIAIDSD